VWLNPDVSDSQTLTPLLHPYRVWALDFYPVSKAVNRAGFESPEFIKKNND
jgi:putative SOS response-associated peptidase YedK